jgi:hypothetical protein
MSKINRLLRNSLLAALLALGGLATAAEVNDLNVTDASNTARFPENMSPSAVNDGARALEGMIARWLKDTNASLTATGTGDAIAVAANQTLTTYHDGLAIAFNAAAANTTGATLAVDSLTAAKVFKSFNQYLVANDIKAGQKVVVIYDSDGDGGNGAWQMVSPLGNAPFADPTTTRGDIIYRNSSGSLARLALGATDYAIASNGSDLTYTGIVKQGTHTIWIPATAMVARTTSPAAVGTAETSTNKVMVKTLDFDASTIEYAQAAIRMPKSWNEGTVTAAFAWSHSTSTAFKVSWCAQALSLADGDALDTAFGTAVCANDEGGTVNDLYLSPATTAITAGNTPGAEDYVVFQFYRNATDGTNDTMEADGRLHGVTIYYGVNGGDDS